MLSELSGCQRAIAGLRTASCTPLAVRKPRGRRRQTRASPNFAKLRQTPDLEPGASGRRSKHSPADPDFRAGGRRSKHAARQPRNPFNNLPDYSASSKPHSFQIFWASGSLMHQSRKAATASAFSDCAVTAPG